MGAGAGLREREIIAAQVVALRGGAAGPAGEFECGASAALCWLLEGGPGPVTGEIAGRPRIEQRRMILDNERPISQTPRTYGTRHPARKGRGKNRTANRS